MLADERVGELLLAGVTRKEVERENRSEAPAAVIDQLKNESADLQSQLDAAQAQVSALQEENASIQGMKERYRGSVPLKWVGGVIAVCLVAGFLVALWWADYRSRKRHGGIRIY